MNIGGNGRKAWIKFDSIRNDIKQKIIALAGDPAQKAKHITFVDYVQSDSFASEFFNSYRLENKEELPEKNKTEYIANAEILNAVDRILSTTMNKRKALGSKVVKPWEKIAEIVSELPFNKFPHSLPANPRRLHDKWKLYKTEGYVSLIHKGFCHKNSEKINDDAKAWVLARWANRVQRCATHMQLLREYNKVAPEHGWKQLKSEKSLIVFLQDPKIEPLWYGHRFGELKSKEKYSYQHTTILPSMRDSLWYSDGTKLNYYYLGADNKPKTCQVYEVFDTYSEVFVGYHISDSENYEAQYHAFKMALQISAHKPYEIKFDNQGGTKKLQANSFLGKLARITRNTTPYNGKSKTIENAFKRFQMEYLKQDWFFTGQNIQAKSIESKADMEMILANAASLPTLDEVKETYRKRRQEWNEGIHSKTGISRLEMYLGSENPGTQKVSMFDMIDMFWISLDQPITCTSYGINFTLKKTEYQYVVMDQERMPDITWLRNNVDKKFVVKYDPDDMTMIQLYEQTPLGLKRVAAAETKVNIHRGHQEQAEWEASFIKQVELENKRIRIEARDQMDAILDSQNMSTESYGLKNPALKGIESSRKQKKARKEKEAVPIDIGQHQKEESFADPMDFVNTESVFSKY
ncbi:hypothetical protein FNO01nite_30150 [Flavobacterium noncentrifugens]|nr:hypothetical protein FNO01nite_30150 [Flavobacterium noncentrifugens]